MEKPNMKKVIQQSLPQQRACDPWYSNSTPIKPNRCRNPLKMSNNRQGGDTRAPKSLNPSSLHLKYGVFHNQPNFTRPGRPAPLQKPERLGVTVANPRRSRILAMNPRVPADAGLKREQEVTAKNVSTKNKLFHHLSLSEVMHIDIKPPRKVHAQSPIYWASPTMNTKYHRTPRGRSPRRY